MQLLKDKEQKRQANVVFPVFVAVHFVLSIIVVLRLIFDSSKVREYCRLFKYKTTFTAYAYDSHLN